MNLSFYILVLFIFILPYSIYKKIYYFDKPEFRVSKIINIIWCVLLIFYISMQTENFRSLITDFELFKIKYLIEIGGLNPWIIFVSKILQILINFYLVIIVFLLMRRDRHARRKILYIVPILFLVETFEMFKLIYPEFPDHKLLTIAVSLLSQVIIFTPLFLTYYSKTFKRMMKLDKKMIKELFLIK